MKRFLMAILLLLSAGCADSTKTLQPIESQLLKPSNEWVKAYGDSERSTVYYNLAVMRLVLNQHAKLINGMLPTTQPATQPTTQPVEK